MSTIANITTVARREYGVRVRTRSFALGTLLLVAGVIAIAFLPLIIRQIDTMDTTDIGIVAAEEGLADAAAASIGTSLNSAAALLGAGGDAPDFAVRPVADLELARAQVRSGDLDELLQLERDGTGDVAVVLYTRGTATQRNPTMLRQAATAFVVADRLERLGVAPADQATLFAPSSFEIRPADPAQAATLDTQAGIGRDMLAFGMTLLIFMIVLMYGTWVAMSVVEEKSSRVMEVILNAATPFQLLAGKVVGVGAVALTQYAAVVGAGLVALVLTNPVASLLAATGTADALPQGLSPVLLLAFAAFGVLGFLLYASLFAAAGSLVSRQEDVNSAVMPLTLMAIVGYMVGVYTATGLIDGRAPWVTVLAVVPFTSPFMMLGRMATGITSPVEVLLALALLAGAIVLALWVAARVYATGVLLYGSRPGWRVVLRLLREGM